MFNKIRDNLNKVLGDINERFDEKHFINETASKPHQVFTESDYDVDDSNPYEGASWGEAENWHCIRCGSNLKEMDEKDPTHGKACYSSMRKNGTLHYQCSNEKCFHYNAPLILHHPIHGHDSPAGDSYSISWIK